MPNVRADLRSLVWNSAISFTAAKSSAIGIKKAFLFSQPFKILTGIAARRPSIWKRYMPDHFLPRCRERSS
ncbi:hypothetical protein [Paenibacillus alkaliterrae]|uniref:hypothetical protein n=1 Tax=Paenibacillus alkaliterrae TaxID=320909 RepID=UPI001F3DA7E8|nr:hypothetical protein [Paenibacillus alkaliterrae]